MVAKRSNTKSSAAAAAAAVPKQSAKAPAVVAKEEGEAPEQSETEDESDAPPADDESGDEEEGEGADSGDETHSEAGGDANDDDDGLDLDVDAPEGDDDDEEEELDAVGFGDAMSKILGQNVAEDAQPILAKRTTQRMREIMAEKKVTKTARISAAEKREKEQKDMIIPDHSTVVQDRRLRTIATKGVVALFNAIEKHQHQSGKKSDEKNDKKVKEMSKDNFLGLLKASQKSVTESAAAAAPAAKSSWSVVQDDFMMGAKLKDWDATHGTEKGRARNHDDDETEAAEDAAWKQVGDLDSDDEGAKAASSSSSSAKRKNAKGSSDRKPAGKKAKRS